METKLKMGLKSENLVVICSQISVSIMENFNLTMGKVIRFRITCIVLKANSAHWNSTMELYQKKDIL